MRKSLWSPDEDEKLRRYVATHGCGNWSDVAKHTGLHRCGKSCRLRWINYLRPDLKRGPFSAHEVRLVVNLHNTMGNSWSKIATQLPGRTDNDVKNFWHSYTRSRRIQQQQQANKGHQSSNMIIKGNDQKASSSHEQYHNGDMHKNSINEQGHMMNKSNNYEDFVQLQPLSQSSNCKNVNNLPQVHVSACSKPSDPYATLNALSHTHLSSISFDHQHNPIVAHINQPGSHVLITQEPNITYPLINLDTKPISLTSFHPHSNEDSALSAFYKGFSPHIFNDPCCSKASPSIHRFQHFPPLREASDHSNIISALPSSHVNDLDSTVKLKIAVINSNPLRINPLIPHEKPHDSLLGEYPAASFDSARSLPASFTATKLDEVADIKPPEGLQSVIWSFLKGQPEACTSADASDDYDKAHYIASNQQHYHHNHIIKPQLEVSHYFSSESHHPAHQQNPSDQCTNAEAFSYTSPSNLQCLQAQYLADCFS